MSSVDSEHGSAYAVLSEICAAPSRQPMPIDHRAATPFPVKRKGFQLEHSTAMEPGIRSGLDLGSRRSLGKGMRRAVVILIPVCALLAYAQARELPDAPAPKRMVIIANVAMWSASFVLADSAARGTRSCVDELKRISRLDNLYTSAGGGTRHPYKKTFAVALPMDAGLTVFSILLHRRRHSALAVWLPSVSMGAQLGAAAVQYGSGCT